MSTTKLAVSGMTCSHCAMAVTRALRNVPGVQSAEVSLELGQATVVGSAELPRLIQAIEIEGYRAQPSN
jgi:copper chaperone